MSIRLRQPPSGGVFLNTELSVMYFTWTDGIGIYSITKAAVLSMTKLLRKECGPLKVFALNGFIRVDETKFALP